MKTKAETDQEANEAAIRFT
jgi:hypothetical protein